MWIKTNNLKLIIPATFYLLFIATWSNADDRQETTPQQLEGAIRISTEELIMLAEASPELTLIDARISSDRVHGYIEGSISLPNTRTDCKSLARVVKSFNHPTVFYCNGPKCGRSVLSIRIAVNCGYNNIYWYRDGFEDWKAKDYPFLTDFKYSQ